MHTNNLREIREAGIQMAAIQHPIYVQKQADLRTKYQHILSGGDIISEEEQKQEEEREAKMANDKLLSYRREKRSKKHIQRMSRREREEEIGYLMKRLYHGLDNIAVPEEFQYLVTTGNPTMDCVNHYNMILSMQHELRKQHNIIF
tara:strand:+ start:1108 stop:1545 length:438 start_codon:yes stop_codon:yes gene_type:complete